MSGVVDPSPVPRRTQRPSWLQPRLIGGLALVLLSVLLGAKVVSSADSTRQFWSVNRDLAGGAVLTADDLRLVRVRVPDDTYLPGSVPLAEVAGRSLNRALTKGELVPAGALDSDVGTRVTIPFGPQDAPELTRGARIHVWLSTKVCAGVTLLDDVTVQDVQSTGGGAFARGGGQTIVVRVDGGLAERITRALAMEDAVLRAGVLDGPVTASPAALPPLDGCVAKK